MDILGNQDIPLDHLLSARRKYIENYLSFISDQYYTECTNKNHLKFLNLKF